MPLTFVASFPEVSLEVYVSERIDLVLTYTYLGSEAMEAVIKLSKQVRSPPFIARR